MIFWHPKGWAMWQQIEQYMRRVYQANGYQEVKCPQILDRSLWEKSGHWENFKDNMFTTESEKREYAIKPMNCPGHIQIFNTGLRSYRDLPYVMANLARAIAASLPAPCTASCGSAASRRTTATFSAPKTRSSPR